MNASKNRSPVGRPRSFLVICSLLIAFLSVGSFFALVGPGQTLLLKGQITARIDQLGGGWLDSRQYGRSGLLDPNGSTLRLSLPGIFWPITYVDLSNTTCTHRDLALLSRCKSLYGLDVSSTRVDDEDLEMLAGRDTLIYLDLRWTEVTDSGLESLKRLHSLREVRLDGTSVTVSGVSGIRNALPHLAVSHEGL